ncbi:MAG: hypothetical protein WBC04_17020 [Candidatus Acidiferrales bacterium]
MKNWARWGADDEIGTLNNISPQEILQAARLIRKGRVFSLALNFDSDGPQNGLWGKRFNPIHTMLATGVDAVAGRQESELSGTIRVNTMASLTFLFFFDSLGALPKGLSQSALQGIDFGRRTPASCAWPKRAFRHMNIAPWERD